MKGIQGGIIFLLVFTGVFYPHPLAIAASPPAGRLVVIDPAHGGNDTGVKLSEKEYEKDLTLQLALELKKELESSGGIKVQLTRTSDVEIPIAKRIKTVRDAKAKMFISLHLNGGFDKKATGYEVYFPGFSSEPERKDGVAAILKDMTGNKYLNESVALAQVIIRNLQNVFSRKGRGLREAPIPILEGLSLPAVVVELGFATNREDIKMITDEKSRRAIVKALSRSVREFLSAN